MDPFRVSSRTLLSVILGIFFGVMSLPGSAQQNPGPTANINPIPTVSIETGSCDELRLQKDVIALKPRADCNDTKGARATAFDNIVRGISSLEMGQEGQEYVIIFRSRGLTDDLLKAKKGDVVVGADRKCTIFRTHCGLMAKITKPPKLITCLNKQRCLELHFRDVGLEQVIESGTLSIKGRIEITSRDYCFGKNMSSGECVFRNAGALPPPGTLPTEKDALAHAAPAGRLIAVQTVGAPCDAAKRLRYVHSIEVSGPIRLTKQVSGLFKYRGTLGFDYKLRFARGALESVKAELESCQAGQVGLRGTARVNNTVALWMRSTRPKVVWVSWVPIVYTLTARLDASVSAQAGFVRSDLFSLSSTLGCSAAWPSNNGAGWRLCAQGSTGHWPPTLSVADDIGARGRATAALIPALQVNVYGVGGPRLSGVIEATATVDANHIKGRLTGSLKPELDSRLLDDPIVSHTYPIFGCDFDIARIRPNCHTAWGGVPETTAFKGLARR